MNSYSYVQPTIQHGTLPFPIALVRRAGHHVDRPRAPREAGQ